MKAIRNLLLLAVTLFLFPSCADSQDKLMKDQISYMEEMIGIINDVADGKLSSADAAVKIKKWGKEGEEIQTRKKALLAKSTPEQLDALGKKYSSQTAAMMKEFMTSLQKLQQSGRATPEIQHAIENVKN